MTTVLACDPGTMTGFSVAVDGELSFADQLPHEEFQAWAHGYLFQNAGLTVVMEKFTITQRTLRVTRDGAYDALETIGVIRYFHRIYSQADLVMQQPSEVMNIWTDEKLKMAGWYARGKGHANDSLRHLAFWHTRHRGMKVPVV